MQREMLVAYVTRSGSTAEVAEAIAKTICEEGVDAKAVPMAEVESIPEHASVILGAALYAGHLPKEFRAFAVRFRRELERVKPWVFVLGPTEKNPKHFASAEEQVRKQLAGFPWLHAADVRILGGKFDPLHLKLAFPFSLAFKIPGNPMRRTPATDIRDWEWIRAWARAIAEHLSSVA